MSRSRRLRWSALAALAFAVAGVVWLWLRAEPAEPGAVVMAVAGDATTPPVAGGTVDPAAALPTAEGGSAGPRALTEAEKLAWIARINRDYDEVRAKGAAEFAAAGANFPGGVQAFLKHLKLLDDERRADLLEVLTPAELEQLEWRETAAGELVRNRLGNSAATEEQRLAVFRLQRDFERQFGLTLDLSPAGLLERERARQQMERTLQGVLGDDGFATWVRAEGPDFERLRAFAVQQALPLDTPAKLWAAKNEFTLQRLELAARTDLTPAQRAEVQRTLHAQTEARVREVLGPVAMPRAEGEILQWLREATTK